MVKENKYKTVSLHQLLTGTKPVDFDNEKANGPDPRYTAWLDKHPSALTSIQEMLRASQGKQIVVFLDYDGTLSPIVSDPERAIMSDSMRLAVSDVARHFPTAIITGRSRDKVYEFVKLDGLYYAGSHGMDIMGPPVNPESFDPKFHVKTLDKKGNEATIFQPAKEYLPSIEKLINELKTRISEIPGAIVENNRFCISVHYRHVLEEDYGTLEKITRDVLTDYPFFHITQGKKVLEIRPPVRWNKGDALVYLLHALGFSEPGSVVPIYIGDDKTDEDAFKVLHSQGQGYPIIVSSVPRETSATHSLRSPSEVLSFLVRLARWGSDQSDRCSN
ncbi:probable trehalose-phosphate phosphatase D [Andrographis paniculata]|uniref:probable trehalose-phosphate phosphatase D n=1 Tax=Andrographis paniculata TaxID=175694 RepID=UPI0021E70FD3|nr:probable trehalose-phosphate phosphatase D [Andrographis paniculata]